MEGATKVNGGPITKLRLLLLGLQGTPTRNPLALVRLRTEAVHHLNLTYTRGNRCTSGCKAHGKIPKGRKERSYDQCKNNNNYRKDEATSNWESTNQMQSTTKIMRNIKLSTYSNRVKY